MAQGTHSAQFGSLENPGQLRLLKVIDQLRELGVGEDISLPQLVVVGDQSSGKSSLLEGLTQLPFPIASDLCTRFATQIVFRRAAEKNIQVSIIPAPNAEDERKADLSKFRKEPPLPLDPKTFLVLLDQAAKTMGLPRAGDPIEDLKTRFSDDVLKIELSGPEDPHLSFVDVPGLFHNPTIYQTAEDSKIIRKLIERYVEDPRTIIIAIMDARNNLANQEVFRMAKTADPQGLRTVGVMTKCDALQRGDEPAAVKIARNQTERLHHGWFVVRNRTTEEIKDKVTMKQRDRNELECFKTGEWSVLDRNRVGIGALKTFLGQLLYEHVAGEFPIMRQEIVTLWDQNQKQLEMMGPPRQYSFEQRQFLLKIAGAYQRQVEDSLSGRYQLGISGQHPSKLRMYVRDLNDSFAEQMDREGHTLEFRSTDESLEVDVNDTKAEESETDNITTATNIYHWVRGFYLESRGTELPGHVNPRVLETLFRAQTVKWGRIAMDLIRAVLVKIEACHKHLLAGSCADENVRRKIQSRLERSTKDAIKKGLAEYKRILLDEHQGILQTTNHYFADNLAKSQAERVVARLKKLGFVEGESYMMNFHAMTSVVHLSNETSAIYNIHDTLKAYYKVSLKRFIDNIPRQVIERHFLGPTGPVCLLTPEFVGQLPDPDLEALAAEDFSTSCRRLELKNHISRLGRAIEISSPSGTVV